MEKLQLKAEIRDGSKSPKALRREGVVPAVLYGHNIPSTSLSLVKGDFERVFKKAGESTIIELVTTDGKVHNVVVQDVQKHYLTGVFIHADFFEVSMTEKMTAEIPLEFVGESLAVKAKSGTLVKQTSSLEVQCLPGNLPHNITVDISVLSELDSRILAKDVTLPSGVELQTEPDTVVVRIEAPRDLEAELSADGLIENVASVAGATETEPESVSK